MPAVTPKSSLLPFCAPEFSWPTFENFFCDFLAAGPILKTTSGLEKKVLAARLYGRKGEKQNGIDIRAEMAGGEIWAFQCKHYPKARWGPGETRKAIEKCIYPADKKILLITRDFSEECRKIVQEHPNWEIWNDREISQNFLHCLPPLEAAIILYRHFGPRWQEQYFDLPGRIPLMGGEAKYGQLLKDGRIFHHQSTMAGRDEWLKALDEFASNKKSRAFLLKGRGGIGKSRLLLEWFRRFNSQHPEATLLFLSDAQASASEYAKSIDLSSKPLVLVMDDAHRLNEIRQILFPIVGERPDVKLVLSLRPGPTAQVRAELLDAQIDSREIVEPEAIQPLNHKEARTLAEDILGSELSPLFQNHLRLLAEDCPLLAILAYELFQKGELSETELKDTQTFKDLVLERGFLRDIEKLKRDYEDRRVQDFVRALSLLSPMPESTELMEQMSAFIGSNPSDVKDIIEQMETAGVLLKTDAGIRIVPDLLSDHLAYEACYGTNGDDRLFVRRFLNHFSSEYFPKVMQHVAEAEWRAFNKHQDADSVTQPLWEWFADRFKKSSFYQRREQLKEWGNIAHFLPARTLELAELALQTTEAPEGSPNGQAWFGGETTHKYLIAGIPELIKPTAKINPDYTQRCLDLLWELGKGEELLPQPNNNDNHPIYAIGEIAEYEFGKSLRISEIAMDWLEEKFKGELLHSSDCYPLWIYRKLLRPFFKNNFTHSWLGGGKSLFWQDYSVSIMQSSPLRVRALDLCQKLTQSESVAHTLVAIEVLSEASRIIRFRDSESISKAEWKQWNFVRSKALSILRETIASSAEPLIHFQIHKLLGHKIRFEKTDKLKEEFVRVIEEIPDSLELKLCRATLSNGYDEESLPPKEQRDQNWVEKFQKNWDEFISSVVQEIQKRFSSASEVIDWILQFATHVEPYDFKPNFRKLFFGLSDCSPNLALEMANEIIQHKERRLGKDLDALIYEPTQRNYEERLNLCRSAIDSNIDSLISGAIHCLSFWQQEATLPDDGWALVEELASIKNPTITDSILEFVGKNPGPTIPEDWKILVKIPIPEETWLINSYVYRTLDKAKHSEAGLDTNILQSILNKLIETPSLDDLDECLYYLGELSQLCPQEVFLLYWNRTQAKKKKPNSYVPIPLMHGLPPINFSNLLEHPQAREVIDKLGNQIVQGPPLERNEQELLQLGLRDLPADKREKYLSDLLERLTTEEQIQRFLKIDTNLALSHPALTRILLQKALALGTNVHDSVVQALTSNQGMRSSSDSIPDPEWKSLLETVEKYAHKYANDSTLGPIYARIANMERGRMEFHMEKAG